VKDRNRAKIDAAMRDGKVRVLLSSQVERIEDGFAQVRTTTGVERMPADHVIVRIGGEAAYPFLERCGVRIVKKALATEPDTTSRAAG
jgi:glycine/D-amino acid oxidase-like deaminating enzyme